MRYVIGCAIVALSLGGCGTKQSSLLLERHARGPLAESALVGQRVFWELEPTTQAQEQKKIEVTATFASQEFLHKFFNDRALFGDFAGQNPYFPENIVFYVKVSNHSDLRIAIDPTQFVLVDDRGNQYATINEDYVDALAAARTPVATMTRGVVEDARPGYFGVGLPLGKIFATKPQGRFALIKKSSLQAGPLYSGVSHDGLVAFWSPTTEATTLRLVITNVKTNFDSEDLPQVTFDFPFSFKIVKK